MDPGDPWLDPADPASGDPANKSGDPESRDVGVTPESRDVGVTYIDLFRLVGLLPSSVRWGDVVLFTSVVVLMVLDLE